MLIEYIGSARKQFLYYKKLGERTFKQLDKQDLFWKPDEDMNSISVIVQHLYGNMMSRWTDFLNSDGEKDFRDREQEFVTYIDNAEDLHKKWQAGWKCLIDALDTIEPEHSDHIIYIRSKGHTIVEAINRQLCHYSYHIGQIVYIGRMRTNQWESLSIPRGESKKFNEESSSKGKRMEHFTDTLNIDSKTKGK